MTVSLDDKCKRILKGDFSDIQFDKSNIVKLFLSSTFSDTHQERDYLIEHIYPLLREYCYEQYGWDFQVIDLRWGITDSSMLMNASTSICMNEIENCKRTSMGPYFVGFLSHRYGTRMIPSEIKKDTFIKIIQEADGFKADLEFSYDSSLLKVKIQNLVDYCYKEDDNVTPSLYRLLDINVIVPGFEFDGDNSKEFGKIWSQIQSKTQDAVRKATDILFEKKEISKEEYEEFHSSVTEQELINGILKVGSDDLSKRVFVFFREIEDIETRAIENTKLGSRFIELNKKNEVDKEIRVLREQLKTRVQERLGENNTKTFKVKWDDKKGIDKVHHAAYLKLFSETFYKVVKTLVDQNTKGQSYVCSSNPHEQSLFDEIFHHAQLCKTFKENLFNRDELETTIKEYILDEFNPYPMVIHGESGSGKTSVLANCAYNARHLFNSSEKTTVIVRFLGTSTLSSNISDVYESIIFQLRSAFKLNTVEYDKHSVNSVKSALKSCLENMTIEHSDEKIIIFLDSLDQLNNLDQSLGWILEETPKQVKIVYSVLNGYQNLLKKLKLKYEFVVEKNFKEVHGLNLETAKSILESWLEKEPVRHKLTSDQWSVINKVLDGAELYPLYVKILFDEIKTWTSYYTPDEKFSRLYSIDKCIQHLFENLEFIHGKLIFSRCMFYLTIFSNGVSENELEDLLSIDDDVLTDVFQHHEPSVRRFPGALWLRIKNQLKDYLFQSKVDEIGVVHWYHRKFKELATKMYVDTLTDDQYDLLVLNIIHYFNETWAKSPKPFEYSTKIQQKKGLTTNKSEAIRKTKIQPLKTVLKNGETIYNKRKLTQLPVFIFRLRNLEFKLNSLSMLFYNNVDFVYTQFLVKSYLFNERSKDMWELYSNSKALISELVLLNTVYEQNVQLLHKFPESFVFQLIAKIASIFFKDNESIRNLIEKYEIESKAFNNGTMLCPLYSYTPLVQSESCKTILFTEKPVRAVITSDHIPVLVVFQNEKLHFVDTTNDTLIESIAIDESLQSVQVYLSSGENLIQNGGIIANSSNQISCFNCSGSVNYKKSLSNIGYVRLLTSDHFCLTVKGGNYFQILNVSNGDTLVRHSFNSPIQRLELNVDIRQIVSKTQIQPVFMVFCLKNGEFEVFKFESEQLVNIASVPTSGQNFLSCKIDRIYYTHSISNQSSEFLIRFACFFELHCSVFSVLRNSTKKQNFDYTITDVRFTDPYLVDPYSSVMVDYFKDLIAFVFNSCIHIYSVDTQNLTRIGYKDNEFGSYPFSTRILSNYSILVFKPHSTYLYKLSGFDDDASFKSVKCSEFTFDNIIEENEFKSEVVIKNGKLIVACSDNSVKQIELKEEDRGDDDATFGGKKIAGHLAGSITDSTNRCFIIAKVDLRNELICINPDTRELVSTVLNLGEVDGSIQIRDLRFSKNCCIVQLAYEFQKRTEIRIFLMSNGEFKEHSQIKTSFVDSMRLHVNYLITQDLFSVQLIDYSSNSIRLYDYMFIKDGILTSSQKTIKVNNDLKQVNYMGLTYDTKYLFFCDSTTKIFYMNVESQEIVVEKEFGIQISQQIQPVYSTDDFILSGIDLKRKSVDMAYLELTRDDNSITVNAFQMNNDRSVLSFKVNKTYLMVIDYRFSLTEIIFDHQTQLKVYDMMKVKSRKEFTEAEFQIDLHSNLQDYCLSHNNEYVFICENLNLCIYRIKGNSKLVNVPIIQPVCQVWSHDEGYINLILSSGELISFMFIDQNNKQKYERVKKIRQANMKLTSLADTLQNVNPLRQDKIKSDSGIQSILNFDISLFGKTSRPHPKVVPEKYINSMQITQHNNSRIRQDWLQ